jgi:hypothetical protein
MSGRHHVSRPARFAPTRLNISVLSFAALTLTLCSVAVLAGVATAWQGTAAGVSDPMPEPPRAPTATSSAEGRFTRAVVPDLVPDDITPYEVITAAEPAPSAAPSSPIGAPPPVLPTPQTQEETVPASTTAQPPATDPAEEPTDCERTTDDELTQFAQTHAEEMAAAGHLFHSDPPAGFSSWAENIASGYGSYDEALAAWEESPDHAANLARCDLPLTGIGISGDYIVQMFGVR